MLLEVSALSPLEFVNREFEHPVIRAGLLFFNGLREVDCAPRDLDTIYRLCWRARESADVCGRVSGIGTRAGCRYF